MKRSEAECWNAFWDAAAQIAVNIAERQAQAGTILTLEPRDAGPASMMTEDRTVASNVRISSGAA